MLPESYRTIVEELLHLAIIEKETVRTIEVAGISTNSVYFVTLRGRQVVLRIYGDSGWPQEYDRARLSKELCLHEMLASRGVAVPKILASVDRPDLQAILMERLPGLPLSSALSEAKGRHDELWAAVGSSLSVIHQVSLSDSAGEIKGEQVEPFAAGGWGSFAMADFVDDVDRLARQLPSLRVDRHQLEQVTSEARRHLDESPVRLLHNDPTADNIFVQNVEGEWHCSGWLDWEFARHGDPAWDCARLELFREHRTPAPSPAFWHTYGELNEVNLLTNRLLVAVFCARFQHEKQQIDGQRHAHAIEWLTDFPRSVSRLDALLCGH